MILLMEPIFTLIVRIGTLRPRQQKGVLSKFTQPAGDRMEPELWVFSVMPPSPKLCRLLQTNTALTLTLASAPMPGLPEREQRMVISPHLRNVPPFPPQLTTGHESFSLEKDPL